MLVFGELSLNFLGWNTPRKTTHHFQPFPALSIHPRNGSSKNTIDGLTRECPYPLVLVKRLNDLYENLKKIQPNPNKTLKTKSDSSENSWWTWLLMYLLVIIGSLFMFFCGWLMFSIQPCAAVQRCIMFFVFPQENWHRYWDTKNCWTLKKVDNKTSSKKLFEVSMLNFRDACDLFFWYRAPKASDKNALHLHGSALGLATNGAPEGLLEWSPSRWTATNISLKHIDLCVALEIDLAVATLRHTDSVHGTLVELQPRIIKPLTRGLHQVFFPHQDTSFRKLLRSDMCLYQLQLFGLQLLDECIVFSQSSCNCCLFICHVSNGNGCIAILLLPAHIARFLGRHSLHSATRQSGRTSNLVWRSS